MRLPRFRLRTLMIAVVVAAIGFAIWHRGQVLNKRADYHNSKVQHMEDLSSREWKQNDWHAAMAAKYRYYASHPWLPIPPDPPEPK